MAKFVTLLEWLELPADVAVQRGHHSRIIYQIPSVDIEFNRYAFSIIYVAWSASQADPRDYNFVTYYKTLFEAAAKDQRVKPGLRYRSKLEKILKPVVIDPLSRRRIIENCRYKVASR